jgi:hypothetical protein
MPGFSHPPFSPPEGRHAPEGWERAREAVPLEAEVAQHHERGERRRERPRQAGVLEVEVVDAALLPQLGSVCARHDTALAGTVLVCVSIYIYMPLSVSFLLNTSFLFVRWTCTNFNTSVKPKNLVYMNQTSTKRHI